MSKITWVNKTHVLPYGTRETQVWDLDMNEIKAVVNANADSLAGLEGGYQGELLIADTPVNDGYYLAGESGTYTNAGNLVVSLVNQIVFINKVGAAFTQTIIDVPVTLTQTLEPTNTTEAPSNKAVADYTATLRGGEVAEGETRSVSGDKVFKYEDSIKLKANEYNEIGLDAITEATWIDGILRADGSITNLGGGFSFYTDEFYEVIPNVSIVNFNGFTSFTTEPIILGYSKDKTTVTVIASGNDESNILNNFYGAVPSGVYFVRFATKDYNNSISIGITKREDYIKKTLQDFPKQINREDYFVGGDSKLYFKDDGTVADGYSSIYGTGYIPVEVGDKIKYKGYTVSTLSSIGGFDENKVFVKKILDKSNKNEIYDIELNEDTDSDIAFIVATHYIQNDPTTPFLIVESSSTIENNIDKLEDEKASSKNQGYTENIEITPFNGNASVTKVDGFYNLETLVNPAYFRLNNPNAKSQTHSNYFYQVELELLDLGGNLDSTIEVFTSYLPEKSDFTFTSVGEKHTFILFNGLSQSADIMLKNTKVGSIFKVTKKGFFWFENNFFDSYSLDEIFTLSDNVDFTNKFFNVSDWATRSMDSEYTKFELLNNQKLVSFGDSITASTSAGIDNGGSNYIDNVADYFRMDLTNLGAWGSLPVDNLNDANLANIPSGATIITITGGTNQAFVDSGDITSRDRGTAQGIINYAIDYIELNHPTAIIVLQTVPYRYVDAQNPSAQWSQMYRDIAAYRNLVVSDIEKKINWNVNNISELLYDLTHPNVYGAKRMASIMIDTIKQVAY